MSKLTDDLRISPALSRRLSLESDEGHAWAVAQLANGELKTTCNAQGAPHMFQQQFAFDLIRSLNQHLPNGGAWSVAWGNNYQHLIIMWMDGDGDIQFTVEDDEPVSEILCAGSDHFVSQCFDAWVLWRKSVEVLDLNPEQTFKRAQGERRPSQT